MADRTAAERQRRYRKHRAGDHSLCPPDREDCTTVTVTASVTRDAVTRDAPDLGTRGCRLWRQLTDGAELQPAERVLAEEACRLADRLDRLDAILRGDEDAWMRFRVNEDGTEVTVTLDKALSEARQQQVALKTLLAELRQSRGSKPQEQPKQEASRRDELAKRREERRRAAGL